MTPQDLAPHQLHGMQPVLQVADMVAAISYYRDVLGLEVDFISGDPPVHARVSAGDVRLRLVPFEGGGARRDRGYYWTHVGEDLDGLFEKFRKSGADIVSPPEDRPWGLRDFRFRDPDGHLHCFAAEIQKALHE